MNRRLLGVAAATAVAASMFAAPAAMASQRDPNPTMKPLTESVSSLDTQKGDDHGVENETEAPHGSLGDSGGPQTKPAGGHADSTETPHQEGAHATGGKQDGGPLGTLGLTADQMTQIKAALDATRTTNQTAIETAHTAALATLVGSGTITQAQADAVTAAKNGNLGSMMTLIKAGTITKAQAKTIRDAYRAADKTTVKTTPAQVIAGLVTSGVITQAEADTMVAALAKKTQPTTKPAVVATPLPNGGTTR